MIYLYSSCLCTSYHPLSEHSASGSWWAFQTLIKLQDTSVKLTNIIKWILQMNKLRRGEIKQQNDGGTATEWQRRLQDPETPSLMSDKNHCLSHPISVVDYARIFSWKWDNLDYCLNKKKQILSRRHQGRAAFSNNTIQGCFLQVSRIAVCVHAMIDFTIN